MDSLARLSAKPLLLCRTCLMPTFCESCRLIRIPGLGPPAQLCICAEPLSSAARVRAGLRSQSSDAAFCEAARVNTCPVASTTDPFRSGRFICMPGLGSPAQLFKFFFLKSFKFFNFFRLAACNGHPPTHTS